MTTTSKKGSQSVKAKPRHAAVKSSPPKHEQTIAELRQELAESFEREEAMAKERQEAVEQQTATSEILGVIASSPTDLQPILQVVAANAARLCDASNAGIWRTDGENCWPVVFHGPVPVPRVGSRPMVRDSNVSRAMIDCQIIHTPDMLSPEAQAEFPGPS